MDGLLASVLEAHGGLPQWSAIRKLTAKLSLGGPFWAARGWPDVYANQVVVIDPHHQHITFAPFTAPDRMSVLEVDPERVSITTLDGGAIEERMDPRRTFPLPLCDDTPWDALQVAYFTSAATWNYLTEPFVLAHPSMTVREIDPWSEDGQTWRRLAVRFPDSIANHNANQIFYYDEDFMQRRMDYAPDVTGNPPVAHYSDHFRSFDGFVFPTRRRVLLHDANGVADQGFAAITIDVDDVKVEH